MFNLISLHKNNTDIICKINVREKKLNVWLKNKANKCFHCTVVIKFYRIFVTELVFTFFVCKYQNHFEFPGGVIKDLLEWKILGVGVQIKESSLGEGVWIYSGTTQPLKLQLPQWRSYLHLNLTLISIWGKDYLLFKKLKPYHRAVKTFLSSRLIENSRQLWNSHPRHKFLKAEASKDILKYRVSEITFPGVFKKYFPLWTLCCFVKIHTKLGTMLLKCPRCSMTLHGLNISQI